MVGIVHKILFGLWVGLFRLFLRQQADCWLIGENMGRLSFDNGYHFYRYCLGREVDAWFVVADTRDVAERDRTFCVRYGSVKHARILATAGVLVYTHTLRDLMYAYLHQPLLRGKRAVFLQHGVTAMKRFNEDYLARKNEMDLFCVVSETEKELVQKYIAPDAFRLAVTGFARYDHYYKRRDDRGASREILYMPTWRDWVSPEDFPESALYREVSALLTSPDLQKLLERFDCNLNFILHINMRELMQQFRTTASARVRILESGNVRLQEYIMRCNALITDYSSISWDFLYLQKPVVFFQFDRASYLERRGSYLDLDREDSLFGYRADELDQVVAALEQVLSGDCQMTPGDEEVRKKWFRFEDGRNCERIYDQILQFDSRE